MPHDHLRLAASSSAVLLVFLAATAVTGVNSACVVSELNTITMPNPTAAAAGSEMILAALNNKLLALYPRAGATAPIVAGTTSTTPAGAATASQIVDGVGLMARFASVTAMTYCAGQKAFYIVDYNAIRKVTEGDLNVTTVMQEDRLINSGSIAVYNTSAFVTAVAGNCVLRIDLVTRTSDVWLGICTQVGTTLVTSPKTRLPLIALPTLKQLTMLSGGAFWISSGATSIYVNASHVLPSVTMATASAPSFPTLVTGDYSLNFIDSSCQRVFVDDVRTTAAPIVVKPSTNNSTFCGSGLYPFAVIAVPNKPGLVFAAFAKSLSLSAASVVFSNCDKSEGSTSTPMAPVSTGAPQQNVGGPPGDGDGGSKQTPPQRPSNNTNSGGGGNNSATLVVIIVVSVFAMVVLGLMSAAIYLCVTRNHHLAESKADETEMTDIAPASRPQAAKVPVLDPRDVLAPSVIYQDDPSMTGSTNNNNTATMSSDVHRTADFTNLLTDGGALAHEAASPTTPTTQADRDTTPTTASHRDGPQLSAELRRHAKRCEYVMKGSFQKGKLLGRGANGSVYAILLKDGSTIAMKEVNLIGTEEEIREMMRSVDTEAELLKNLLHENLVTYYGVQCDFKNLTVRLFMENVTGGCLGAMVRSMDERLSEDTARIFTYQIVKGLAFIHTHGIMHRDLKCDNILRDAHTGLIKLADFGTAKKVGNATHASRAAQTMIGTPYLMAPEILLAGMGEVPDAGYGTKADIWSLGITVAEMVNKGNFPWPTFPSPGHAFLYIASPQGVPTMPEGLSAECQDFIRKCTDRDPKTRPSAEELLTHEWFNALPKNEDSFSIGMANEASAAE